VAARPGGAALCCGVPDVIAVIEIYVQPTRTPFGYEHRSDTNTVRVTGDRD
jgi:hypothetical protein